MDLKRYQRRVVDEIERYLAEVAKERGDGNTRFASTAAWENLHLGKYNPRKNGLGEDLTNFCIKVPTGGGKTLLATQALGSIYRTILKERNGAGLVLWVVPSNQIYRDTLKRLRDRNDLYRLMLEHAVSRRLEIWEKHEIARLSAARLRDCLNILIVQLASTNRETKEQLKFFRDSGGNIVEHFPPENDSAAQRRLKEQFPNLDMIENDPDRGRHLVATSIGNLVRLCRPPVILDEGHKATSKLAVETIEGFNASVIVELSATPPAGANLICRVTGQELLDEQMIKLPLNIATSGVKKWTDVLTQARDKREALAAKAHEYFGVSGKTIRPIVLVQVERTGKDQREKGLIHSEQVKEHLIQRLDIPEKAIVIKSAEDDGLAEIDDLLDPGCPVEWIITKSALQEGWDCPFAYILVSLSSTGSGQSMTQLVGRVLRQPYQERTTCDELNESYILCLHKRSDAIAREVKSALENEGYEGDAAAIVDASGPATERQEREIRIRQSFLDMYQRPFEGKIYLPRFCIKNGDDYEALDYFRHLVSQVNVVTFEYRKIDWVLTEEVRAAKDRFFSITLGEGLSRQYERDIDYYESDEQVLGWLAASLKFDYLSHKQLRHIVSEVYERLLQIEIEEVLRDRMTLVKFVVRDKIQAFVQEQIDKQTEKAFAKLHDEGRLQFYLQCADCRFQIPESIKIFPTRPLVNHSGELMKRSLFDYVEDESQNEYEREVAICLDHDANVLWWYRNLVGKDQFMIQGYRHDRIYPDFVVQKGLERPRHTVLVLESKGKHLQGNQDTTYKRNVAGYFEKAGRQVTWQQLGEGFKDHVFRFQILDEAHDLGRDWKDQLRDLLRE